MGRVVDCILGAAVLRTERQGLTEDLRRCVRPTLEADRAAGRVETLRVLARMLDRRDLRDQAHRLATLATAPALPERIESGTTLLQGYPGQAWMHLALAMDAPTSILMLEP